MNLKALKGEVDTFLKLKKVFKKHIFKNYVLYPQSTKMTYTPLSWSQG